MKQKGVSAPPYENTVGELKKDYCDSLFLFCGALPETATPNDHYMALAFVVRARILHNWLASLRALGSNKDRVVCYFSAEFLPGPHLGNALVNLGITDQARAAMKECGQDLDRILAQEEEPGLGNGGLGRLAACFLDSLATLNIPAIGYGICYEFGIFDQEIQNGWQVEKTDKWLRFGNPWEIRQPEYALEVRLGGHTEPWLDSAGRYRVRWVPERVVRGIPCSTPIPGYRTASSAALRLWKAEACETFDLEAFNAGDYMGAVNEKIISETISKILYPKDETAIGKKLRLSQQYFFVSCSLQDLIRIHKMRGLSLEVFHESFAIQLNDTHPSIAIAELMRLLVDEHDMEWEKAWNITRQTFSYTNHTLLPEALEKWPIPLFSDLLPRHLEIIFEINAQFLEEVRRRFPHDGERARRLSLIDEGGNRSVRMAHLAVVGSHTVNGVAELHTSLLKEHMFKDFQLLWPEKFQNITNGVTFRRWLLLCNPRLSTLITEAIGERWIRNGEALHGLEPLADDGAFREKWRKIKLESKIALAGYIFDKTGVAVDPNSLFDIQVKRIHEYKRQHLNALDIIRLYHRLKQDPGAEFIPRVFIFGGKAAPDYTAAKLIIRLITAIGEKINHDPDVNGRIKVVFIPDFNVTVAQRIYPAADLSEQISTAGMEASGTGNMKFALNSALTIGTLDGANVEIREAVGDENFFHFGLTASEAAERRSQGYPPRNILASCPELKSALESLYLGDFSPGAPGLFRSLVDDLLDRDPFLVLADFAAYTSARQRASALFRDKDDWTRKSIYNTARSGRFSSDRAIREYAEKIWKVHSDTAGRKSHE